MSKTKISILGSTGSIGTSTLKVARKLKDQIEVVALAINSNIAILKEQIEEFKPKMVAIYDAELAAQIQAQYPNIKVVSGDSGLDEVATIPEVDIVVSAIVGFAGLRPTMAAIEAGKDIALANKEVLVAAGEIVTQAAKKNNVRLLPVDSEHSAIFQCLQGEKKSQISRLILVASGGPFRKHTLEQLQKVTIADALAHPTWKMGDKISIDSSTLMNKGLEVIEAHWLFDVPLEKIEIVVHPQSIVHSMVEFNDRSIIAQMSRPDMALPIQYALTYPNRYEGVLEPFDFSKHTKIEFIPPEWEKFRCLKLAYQALKAGGSLPCYMNAVNEVLVDRFLKGEFHWTEIPLKIELLMKQHQIINDLTLDKIYQVDKIAREEAKHI